MKRKIAIIAGGDSSELGVSLKSAAGIFSFIDKEKYDCYIITLVGTTWQVEYSDSEKLPIDKNDFSFSLNGEKVLFDFAYITIHGTPGENGILRLSLPDSSAPENPTLGDRHYRERGLCQITLMYPSNTGTADAFYRAEAIQTAFERGVTLIKDGVKVCIQKTPSIERSFINGDRFVVPISIYYIAEINL